MKQQKLKTQIVIISGVLVLATILLYMIVILMMRYFISEDMQVHNESMSKIAVDQINDTINLPLKMIKNVDHMIQNHPIDGPIVTEYLETVQLSYPYFEEIQIINLEGFILNAAPYDNMLIDNSVEFEPYYLELEAEDNNYHWSEVYISSNTGNPIISVTIRESDYLIAANLDLKSLPITLGSENYFEEIYNISILDKWGTYILANDYKKVLERRRYDKFDQLINGMEDQTWYEERSLNIGVQRIESPEWYLIFEFDFANSYRDIEVFSIAALFFWVFIVSFIAILLRKYFMRIDYDINKLKIKTHSVIENNQVEELEYPLRYKELEGFNQDFNFMIESIRKRENEIQDLNSVLERSVEKAEEANEAKSKYLSIMSHEMRTPLNGIRGFLQMLCKTKLDSEQSEILSIIINSSDILLELINDILDVEKYATGKMTFADEPIHLKSSIEKIVKPFKRLARVKGVLLSVTFTNIEKEYVKVDNVKLEQLFNNLLSNAIKFTKEGEINVEINTKVEENRLRLEFTVHDTGIGIREEVKPYLFIPFSQADAEISKKFGGTGLGLAICKEIVSHYDGNIDYISEFGKGSRFYGYMNVEVFSDTFADQKDTSFANGKILIAEDNFVNQKLMKKFLDKYKVDYLVASNGQEAVRICEEENISLVFMDCQMPIMDGFEATRVIRANHKKNITIVAMTAYASKDDKKKCLEAGMNEYLSKPIDLDELEAILGVTSSHQHADSYNEDPEQSLIEKEIQLLMERINFDYESSSDLIYTFIDQLNRGLNEIKGYLEKQDLEYAARKIHQLKGAAAAVRIERIRIRVEKMEFALKKEDLETVNLLIQEIMEDPLMRG